MVKCKLSLILLLILLSCNTEKGTEDESRIIYELEGKYSEFIINHFEKRFNESREFLDKYNLDEQQVEIICQPTEFGAYRIAFYTNTDLRAMEYYVNRTNRYSKLKDIYIIPIVFSEDIHFKSVGIKSLSTLVGG